MSTSYAHSFLASTHARFYKELNRQMSYTINFKGLIPRAIFLGEMREISGEINVRMHVEAK